MICPNLNNPEVKAKFDQLLNVVPEYAYYLWDKYQGEVPAKYYNLPSTQVKGGVPELFESNSELADAVYEVLGFENKLKTSLGKELEYKDAYVSVSRLKDFKQYQVLDEKGNDIGSVVIEYRGDKTVILHPKLNISGKGYGKDLYKFVSNKFGVEIQEWNEAGISKSDSAKAMWDSLEKKGTAKRIIDEEQGDNFRVLKYINQITPQQKQQAQQLYSQYLDSVFPDSKVKDIVYHGTPDGRFDSFDINQAGKNTKQSTQGIYFTDSKKTADFYAEGSIDFSQFESLEEYNAVKTAKVFSAILNAKNLKLVDNPQAQDRQGDAVLRTIDKLADNGIVGDIDFAHQYIVFEPEQIYILSSKADIQGFKDYMAFQNSEFAKYGTYEQFRQFIISKSSMQIENRLIETGKIDRVC
jgi:hypothetical protein